MICSRDWIEPFPVASMGSMSSARRAWAPFALGEAISTSSRSSAVCLTAANWRGSGPCTWSVGLALVGDGAVHRRWPLVCNGIYLRHGDLSRSALEVTPIAGHVAGRFRVGERAGFDVNPVTWHLLARHGIAVRGPPRDRRSVHVDEAQLRAWTLENLNGYWRRWAQRARRTPSRSNGRSPDAWRPVGC